MSREDEYYQGLLKDKDEEIEILEKKVDALFRFNKRRKNGLNNIQKNLNYVGKINRNIIYLLY